MSRDRDRLLVELNEFWNIDSYLHRSTIASKFKNDEVTIVFDISVFEEVELDKSELRNLLLGELV
jgi:hypothetical protein